jgi:hypothetical protein
MRVWIKEGNEVEIDIIFAVRTKAAGGLGARANRHGSRGRSLRWRAVRALSRKNKCNHDACGFIIDRTHAVIRNDAGNMAGATVATTLWENAAPMPSGTSENM